MKKTFYLDISKLSSTGMYDWVACMFARSIVIITGFYSIQGYINLSYIYNVMIMLYLRVYYFEFPFVELSVNLKIFDQTVFQNLLSNT